MSCKISTCLVRRVFGDHDGAGGSHDGAEGSHDGAEGSHDGAGGSRHVTYQEPEEKKGPRPTLFDIGKQCVLQLLSDAHKFFLNIQKDPFKVQVIKSTVFFSLGLKLFRDMSKHLSPRPIDQY